MHQDVYNKIVQHAVKKLRIKADKNILDTTFQGFLGSRCRCQIHLYILKTPDYWLMFCFTADGEQLILVMKHHDNMCITVHYTHRDQYLDLSSADIGMGIKIQITASYLH